MKPGQISFLMSAVYVAPHTNSWVSVAMGVVFLVVGVVQAYQEAK